MDKVMAEGGLLMQTIEALAGGRRAVRVTDDADG